MRPLSPSGSSCAILTRPLPPPFPHPTCRPDLDAPLPLDDAPPSAHARRRAAPARHLPRALPHASLHDARAPPQAARERPRGDAAHPRRTLRGARPAPEAALRALPQGFCGGRERFAQLPGPARRRERGGRARRHGEAGGAGSGYRRHDVRDAVGLLREGRRGRWGPRPARRVVLRGHAYGAYLLFPPSLYLSISLFLSVSWVARCGDESVRRGAYVDLGLGRRRTLSVRGSARTRRRRRTSSCRASGSTATGSARRCPAGYARRASGRGA